MISHKPLTDDDKKHMGQIRCDESDCVCVSGWRWGWQRPLRLWRWDGREEGRAGWALLHADRRDLWTQGQWVQKHCSDDSLSPAVMQCVQSDRRCETQQIFDHRTVGAFPLPFKLRKLKLRIESIHKNAHISRKRFYARMRWFFRQCKNFFFCIYRSHGVCKMSYMIILQCTITSKKHLIVALKYKGLCLLFNLHCTQAAQCIWAARFWSSFPRCFYKASCTRLLLQLNIAKIHHNPIKFHCHNLLREEKIVFVA